MKCTRVQKTDSKKPKEITQIVIQLEKEVENTFHGSGENHDNECRP